MCGSCLRYILLDLIIIYIIVNPKRKQVLLMEFQYKELLFFGLLILDILILHKNLLKVTQFHNLRNTNKNNLGGYYFHTYIRLSKF